MRTFVVLAFTPLVALALSVQPAPSQGVKQVHAIAMHGTPKYGPDFKHFDYANPNAPKGGNIRLSAIGTFDNFNPYTITGVPAAGFVARWSHEPAEAIKYRLGLALGIKTRSAFRTLCHGGYAPWRQDL